MKEASNNTLFVRSLAFTTTAESLTTHFSFVAPVKHAYVVLDPATKKSRGFGFVTFAEDEDAKNAVDQFNGKELDGRKLKVEIAEARHRAGHAIEGAEERDIKPVTSKEDVEKRNPRLIVRNLPWSIRKPDQLYEAFKKFGKVKDVIIPAKKGAPAGSGLLAGFAFVTMKKYKHAQRAIEGLNGKDLSGRPVAVDWAVEKDKWEKVKTEGGELEVPQIDDESDDSSDDESVTEIKEEVQEKEGLDEHIDNMSDKSEDEEDEENVYDNDMSDEDDDEDDEEEEKKERKGEKKVHENSNLVLFLRNLPFSVNDQSLQAHFQEKFGPVRYARIVMDWETERPRGTGFVAFYEEEPYLDCLRNAPKPPAPGQKTSILQSESQDPDGKYTLHGRVLIVSKAVDRSEAGKLAEKSLSLRETALQDKRHLYLLMEGNIPSNIAMYQLLTPSERAMRDASLKQRKALIQSNPSLHVSLTRLSIRNLPRSITLKDLKFLAREAVVGFSSEVRAGHRAALSKEEIARGGDEAKLAEQERRKKGKGVVRQVKIVEEASSAAGGGGRSKGYGFIEYVSHRWALMGLRWLNSREVGGGLELPTANIPGRKEKLQIKANQVASRARASVKDGKPEVARMGQPVEKKKRLIVEFALENAQVVHRRKETEEKWRQIALEKKAAAAGGKPAGKATTKTDGEGEGEGEGKGKGAADKKKGKGKGGKDGLHGKGLHGKEFRTGKRDLEKKKAEEKAARDKARAERPKGDRPDKPANGGGNNNKRKRPDGEKQEGGEGKKVALAVRDKGPKAPRTPKTAEQSATAMANRMIARKRQQKRGGK
ncbi:ribosome biogenesis protein Nop4 [Peziza echinospora]|nr:ribosome biogenesis protein Nop4 [Peziza echinospora]